MYYHAFSVTLLIAFAWPARAEWLDNWEIRSPSVPATFFAGLTYGGGTFVVVGAFYEDDPTFTWRPVVLTSPDGNVWTSRPFPANAPQSVAYGNGLFVSVGGIGGPRRIATSPDGASWTLRTAPASAGFLDAISFSNGRFVAVGSNGTVLTSPDGTNWTEAHYQHATYLYGSAYGNGKFVAVGWLYRSFPEGVYRFTVWSHDGISWYGVSGATTNLTYNAVTFGKGMFLAVGNGGITAVSTNGFTWFDHWSGATNDLFGVTYYDGTFVAVGTSGAIVTSTDGFSWTQRVSSSNAELRAVASGNLTLVAVGGQLLQSIHRDLCGKPSGANGFELTFTSGDFGLPFRIQASTDLSGAGWMDLFSFTNSTGTNRFLDMDARILSRRYYRISPP